jgi:hypothetical protein
LRGGEAARGTAARRLPFSNTLSDLREKVGERRVALLRLQLYPALGGALLAKPEYAHLVVLNLGELNDGIILPTVVTSG